MTLLSVTFCRIEITQWKKLFLEIECFYLRKFFNLSEIRTFILPSLKDFSVGPYANGNVCDPNPFPKLLEETF
jgi:hypothetical protein